MGTEEGNVTSCNASKCKGCTWFLFHSSQPCIYKFPRESACLNLSYVLCLCLPQSHTLTHSLPFPQQTSGNFHQSKRSVLSGWGGGGEGRGGAGGQSVWEPFGRRQPDPRGCQFLHCVSYPGLAPGFTEAVDDPHHHGPLQARAPFLCAPPGVHAFKQSLNLVQNAYKAWGTATTKAPARPLQRCPERPSSSPTRRAEPGCRPAFMPACTRRTTGVLTHGKATEENQPPPGRVPALLE